MHFSDFDVIVKANPIFQAIYGYVMIFAMFPLSFWLGKKIVQVKDGKESIQGVIFKLFTLAFFLFYWQPFFMGIYYLNDALEARINQIDISSSLPGYIAGTDQSNMDNVISVMYNDYQLKAMKEEYEFKQEMDQRLKEQKIIEDNIDDKDAVEKLVVKGAHTVSNAFAKAGNIWQQDKEHIKDAVHKPGPENLIKIGISFLASIAKDIVIMVRIGFSYLFYIIVPFLVVASYIPILGDQDDMAGLNSFSKKTINWCINMAFWPSIYALLDKILLVMYYSLRDAGKFDSIGTYTAYFAFYLIAYITIPMAIQKANPYGVMHGMISAVTSIATIGAGLAVSAAKGGAGSSSLVTSAISGIKSTLSSAKSNSEAANPGE